jgi:hypothetical protein
MTAHQEKFTMPSSVSAPLDLPSYTRSMHQHTMRQIAGMDPKGAQSGSSSQARQSTSSRGYPSSSASGMGRQSGRAC